MAVRDNVSQTTQSSKPDDQTTIPYHLDTWPATPVEAKHDNKPQGNRNFGALVLVAAIIPLPFLAGLITIIAYLSRSPLPPVALIMLGLIITLVLWLLLR